MFRTRGAGAGVLNYGFIITLCARMIIGFLSTSFLWAYISSRRHSRPVLMTVFNFPLTFPSRSQDALIVVFANVSHCLIPADPFSSLSANRARDVGDDQDVDHEEEEEEEDPYESIYEEVGPPDRIGGGDDDDDADQFYGSESDFDEIPDDDEKVH